MKRVFISSVLALAGVMSLAQTPPASPQAATSSGSASAEQLPSGVAIVAELAKSLDAKKIKSGDKVEARVTMDLLSHGAIVVPRNAKILGHVTDVKVRSKDESDSVIGIAFDRLILKNGHEVPLTAAIQAVGGPLVNAAPMSGDPLGDAGSGIPDGIGGLGRTPPGYPPRPVGPPGNPGAVPDSGASNQKSITPLGPTSQGVVGMRGISLKSSSPDSTISSSTENVRLSSGTQLVIKVAER
jgi:hypothetical protein